MSDFEPKIDDIFLAAIEKESLAERNQYLDEVCAGNIELRQQVERLLAAHPKAGKFMESPVAQLDPTVEESPIAERPGLVIGPYKLLQELGHGGMGIVFMADQSEPVKRRVALKIIKPGMDTRRVIARFEAERQALAMMDHPNIATVLDAGTTSSGRPFFVMELVKGTPITQYCDEHHLTPRERLELFIPVCHAVQHAHQKGVIHRDIKPSNILVADYDDTPVPKIIDFGLAKAVGFQLTQKTCFTEYGQIVGTIHYMSPEQAKLNQLDIDTRTDIYSLGVVLYELLTGETPFARQRLQAAAFDEMLRIIREVEPPRPSLRLSTSDSLPTIAANRHVEPNKLSAFVQGDLDVIILKSLEKDRSRRYSTPTGLANDVQRFLAREPIEARPPSTAYRLQKLYQRNRMAIVTASIVACLLVVATIVSTQSALRATAAKKEQYRLWRKAELAANREREMALREMHLRREAQQREREVRWDAYVNGLYPMREAWEEGEFSRLNELLRKSTPLDTQPDFRGWEWYYLENHARSATSLLQQEAGAIAWNAANNNFLSSTLNGNEIQQWDADSLRVSRRFQVGFQIRYLNVSPDGTRIAIGGNQGQLRIVDAESAASIWDNEASPVLRKRVGEIHTMAWSPDASTFAGGIGDGQIAVVNIDDESIRLVRLNQRRDCRSLDWHPTEPLLAVVFKPRGSAIINLRTGEPVPFTGYNSQWHQRLRWSPSGKMLLAVGGGFISVHVTSKFSTLRSDYSIGGTSFESALTSAAWLDDSRIVLAEFDGRLCVWHAMTGELLNTQVFEGTVRQIAVDPLRHRVLTQSYPHEVHISSTASPPSASVESIDTKKLRVANAIPAYIDIVERLKEGYLTWTPDGRRVTVDVTSLDALDAYRGKVDGEPYAIDPTGAVVAARIFETGSKEVQNYKWNGFLVNTHEGTVEFDPDSIIIPAWDPAGAMLWFGTSGGDIDVRRGSDYRQLAKLAGHRGLIHDLCFSPDGRRVATASRDGTCRIWDVATGHEVFRLGHENSDFRAISWSPDGSRIAAFTEDGNIVVWGSVLIRAMSDGPDVIEASGIARELKKLGDSLPVSRVSDITWPKYYEELLNVAARSGSKEPKNEVEAYVEAALDLHSEQKSETRRDLIKALIHVSGEQISPTVKNSIAAKLLVLLDEEISANPLILSTYHDVLDAHELLAAADADETELWRDALAGLTKIIESDPGNAVVLRYRAIIYDSCLHEADRAYQGEVAALTTVYEQRYGSQANFPAHYYEKKAELGIHYGRVHDSIEDYATVKLLEPGYNLTPPQEKLWQWVHVLGRQSDWEAAAELLWLLTDLDPDDHRPPDSLAPVLAKLRRSEEYRRLCSQILARFTGPNRERVAMMSCLWLRDESRDYDRLVNRLQSIPERVWWRPSDRPICIGLAHLRNGSPAEAIEWFENQSLRRQVSRIPFSQVWVLAARSLAYADIGDHDKANEMLHQATKRYAEDAPPEHLNNLGNDWLGWLRCQVLIAEAKERLETTEVE